MTGSGFPDAYVYQRIAADLRTRIDTGDLKPGARLPAETTLQAQYGVARATVAHAIRVLCQEGLVVVRHGHGTFVREHAAHHEQVALGAGRRVRARMPTQRERARLGLPEGVPVLVVVGPDDEYQVHAGDRTELVAPAVPPAAEDRPDPGGDVRDSPPQPARRRQRLTDEQWTTLTREVVDRYEAGESIRAIAQSTGYSYGYVQGLLCDSGARIRRPLTEEQRAALTREIVTGYEAGAPVSALVKATGRSDSFVRKILNENGVSVRQPRPVWDVSRAHRATFGRRFRSWRRYRNFWSMDEFADALGTSPEMVRQVEGGRCWPTEDFVARGDEVLRAGGALLHLWRHTPRVPAEPSQESPSTD